MGNTREGGAAIPNAMENPAHGGTGGTRRVLQKAGEKVIGPLCGRGSRSIYTIPVTKTTPCKQVRVKQECPKNEQDWNLGDFVNF